MNPHPIDKPTSFPHAIKTFALALTVLALSPAPALAKPKDSQPKAASDYLDGHIYSTCAPWDGPAFMFSLPSPASGPRGSIRFRVYERLPNDQLKHTYRMGSKSGMAHITLADGQTPTDAKLVLERSHDGSFKGKFTIGASEASFELKIAPANKPQYCG